MPTPYVLRPTAAEFVNSDPVHGPLDGPPGHRKTVLRSARWWATCPDEVARAGATYMLDLFDQGGPRFGYAYTGPAWDQARADAGDRDLFARVPDHYVALTRVGADPAVLVALRGSRMTHRNRLMVATSGLSPAEAQTLSTDGTLDMDAVRTMIALRRRR